MATACDALLSQWLATGRPSECCSEPAAASGSLDLHGRLNYWRRLSADSHKNGSSNWWQGSDDVAIPAKCAKGSPRISFCYAATEWRRWGSSLGS
jgi:hypothetical protein